MRFAFAILAVLALLMLLKWQFPYALQSSDDQMHLLYMVTLLALVGSGFLRSRDIPLSHTVKIIAAWLGIFVILILGYSMRDMFLNNRLIAELLPHRAQLSEDGTMSVRSGADGHFHIEMQVNGVPVKFLVDTGASNIVLSPRDATRIGIDTETLNYNRMAATANGTVKGAVVRLRSLEVGKIILRDVEATVNGAPMEGSLLGMDFLKSLRSYRVEGNTLTLVP